MCTGMAFSKLETSNIADTRADLVVDTLTFDMLGVVVDVLVDVEIIVMTAAVMVFDFVSEVAYALEVCAGPILGGVSGIGTNADASGVAAAMTALELVALARFEKLFCSLRAAFRYWLMISFICARTLQACKPLDHV